MLEMTRTKEKQRPVERTRLYRLGFFAALHPMRVIGCWLVLLVAAVFSAGYFTTHLTGNNNAVIGSDSRAAAQLIKKSFPDAPAETDFVVVHSTALTADDQAFHQVVNAAVARYAGATTVSEVASPYDTADRLIATDRHTALVAVTLDGTEKEVQKAAAPLQDATHGLGTGQVEVYFTGSAALTAASVDQGSTDLAAAERIGLPAAAVVLVIAFGSLVAASIPLALGIVAVLAAFGVLGVVSFFVSFDVFVQTAVSMVGIALGIDYSLFIVTRFREELARMTTGDREERARAVGRTLVTAGQAVLFSGTTVVMSLAGLWLVRSTKVYSMALGMTAAVLVMMAISVTLLPAVLGLLGRRVNQLALPWARSSLTHPDPEHSMWARVTAVVMRRRVIIAVVAVGVLGVLSLPVFSLRQGVDLGVGAVKDTPAGKGFAVVSQAFAPGVLTPINVIVSHDGGPLTDAQLDAVARFTADASGDPEAAEVESITSLLDARAGGHTAAQLAAARTASGAALNGVVSADGRASLITVRPRHSADTSETANLVRRLRDRVTQDLDTAGLNAHTGGGPAEIVDITNESSRAVPLVLTAVLAASWLLLLFAFRSFVLPFKAVAMNLITSGAAFGLTVFVFQEGHGASLLGIDRTGFIQAVLPLFSFAVVFGLSMDYEVFMMSRMREEWERTGDSARAVQLGITRTARVITAAATIMVVVFASFLFTHIMEIKQMGFMLALAVLIDATIVRLMLVPALMRMLGRWGWWLPSWLDRVLPRVASGGH